MPLMLIEKTEKSRSDEPGLPQNVGWNSRTIADDRTLEFGRFQVLLRRRELCLDGVPVKLGSRAFELLLVLLEADGSLVTKNELLHRVWPCVFVAEGNLKVQIYALRCALGDDRDLIRVESGRGYRFTGTIRWTGARSARRGSRRVRCQPSRRIPAAQGPRLSYRGSSWSASG